MYLKKSQELEILNYAKSIGIEVESIKFYNEKNIQVSGFRDKVKKIYSRLFLKNRQTFIRIVGHGFIFKISSEQIFPKILNFDGYGQKLTFYPAKDKMIDSDNVFNEKKGTPKWNEIQTTVKSWLNLVKLELDAIEEIQRLISIPDFIEYGQFKYEEKFTREEKKVLKIGIDNLKQKISVEFDLTDYKLNLINTKLDELSIKVDNINKFDFKSAFFGLMVNIASSVLYDNVGTFWNLVKGIFPKSIPQNEI